ncbi:MAG: hypothetical protein LBQ93_04690 [Treponema sp.]|jgi:hypothetical protein|nr:hypothetical protein [Treponema sp.]
MKKALLFFVLTAGVNSSALLFSEELRVAETWLFLGFEYGNFFESDLERGNKVESYTGSPGINLGSYCFWNEKNIGLFIHDIFAFPVTASEKTNGVTTKIDLANYDFLFQTGIIIGPGFRYDINEKLTLKYAVGLGYLQTSVVYTEYIPTYGDASFSMLEWNFGIGGDVGVKFNITDTVFLTAGSIFTFDFARFISAETSFGVSSSGWAEKFFMFGLRPYISIGVNLRWEYY